MAIDGVSCPPPAGYPWTAFEGDNSIPHLEQSQDWPLHRRRWFWAEVAKLGGGRYQGDPSGAKPSESKIT